MRKLTNSVLWHQGKTSKWKTMQREVRSTRKRGVREHSRHRETQEKEGLAERRPKKGCLKGDASERRAA